MSKKDRQKGKAQPAEDDFTGAFAGDAPQMDDVTAVVIRRTAGARADTG